MCECKHTLWLLSSSFARGNVELLQIFTSQGGRDPQDKAAIARHYGQATDRNGECMSNKAISNEEIIAALLSNGTIREAAEAAGTNPRTLYDRMGQKDFIIAYSEAKTAIIRKAVFDINARLGEAVEVIAEIMNDKEAPPAVRLQAADKIISNAEKFTARLNAEEYQTTVKASEILDLW